MLSQDSACPTAYMQRFCFTLGIVLPLICFFAACGKRRPPLPPVERIPQRTELLSGVQRGNQVILIWPAPRRSASAARVSQPPALMSITNPNESSIVVRWQPPTANVDGSTPVNLLGYNVYRTDRSQQEPGQTPLNKALVGPNEMTYADQTFRFGEEY